jgi:hypothetical protein
MHSGFHRGRSRIIPVVEIEHGGAGVNTLIASLATEELPYEITMIMVK